MSTEGQNVSTNIPQIELRLRKCVLCVPTRTDSNFFFLLLLAVAMATVAALLSTGTGGSMSTLGQLPLQHSIGGNVLTRNNNDNSNLLSTSNISNLLNDPASSLDTTTNTRTESLPQHDRTSDTRTSIDTITVDALPNMELADEMR